MIGKFLVIFVFLNPKGYLTIFTKRYCAATFLDLRVKSFTYLLANPRQEVIKKAIKLLTTLVSNGNK